MKNVNQVNFYFKIGKGFWDKNNLQFGLDNVYKSFPKSII